MQPEPKVVHEPRWPATLAVVLALVLYVTLPSHLILGPLWLMPLLVLVPLAPLVIVSPERRHGTRWPRPMAIGLIAVLNLFNVATLGLFILSLLATHSARLPAETGTQLLVAAMQIWFTNIIVYALWFWEIDGGGPEMRAHASLLRHYRHASFLFPQMALGPQTLAEYGFRPRFFDYVFLAFTNATAFSPADTFPLTRLAKALMMGEALISLATIAIIVGRAIGILG